MPVIEPGGGGTKTQTAVKEDQEWIVKIKKGESVRIVLEE